MYSNPAYYALLLLSFITFSSYIYSVYKNNKIKIEFVDTSVIDNNAYWVYNNKLYYGSPILNSTDDITRLKIKLYWKCTCNGNCCNEKCKFSNYEYKLECCDNHY